MSMIGNFLLLPDQRLRALQAEPEAVFAACEQGEQAGDATFVDVDKAWHCLHFLLTKTAEGGTAPLDFIMGGGHEVGSEDIGYGPARAFLSSEVARIAAALQPFDHAALAARFDAKLMDRLEIYPDAGRWSDYDPRSAESFGYFLEAFDRLRALVEAGRDRRLGMLVWLS